MSTQIIASIITGCCTMSACIVTVVVQTRNQTRVLKEHVTATMQNGVTTPTEAQNADR